MEGFVSGAWGVIRNEEELGSAFIASERRNDTGGGSGDVAAVSVLAGTWRPVEESLHRDYVEI